MLQRRLRRHGHGQKRTIRARASNPKNSQARKEDCPAHNEFIRSFFFRRHPLGASPLRARKKSSACQTTELAQVQHPGARTFVSDMKARLWPPTPPRGAQRREILRWGLKVISALLPPQRHPRPKRSLLMGRNGTGQDHAAQIISGATLPATSKIPTRDFSHRQRRGSLGTRRSPSAYFAQDHGDSITKGMTAIDWLWQFDPSANSARAPRLNGPDALQRRRRPSKAPQRLSSGGESARLIFCKLMLQKPKFPGPRRAHQPPRPSNPSNAPKHSASKKYDGLSPAGNPTTHDVIDEVATRIWHFQRRQKSKTLRGPYEEYLAYAQEKSLLAGVGRGRSTAAPHPPQS